jgi:ATP-dependent Clp protease ATP-binding subunit ClpC
LKHNFIGTEHLLWGLASEGSLASFLTPLGVTPERIHGGLVFLYERHAQLNPSAQAQLNQSAAEVTSSADAQPDVLKLLTPRAKEMIVLAGDEAKSQGEKSIRPAHLLLGMLQEGSGIGARLVGSLGVSLLQARAALAPPIATQTCSFCGRTGSLVKRIFLAESGVGGPAPSSSICDQCVERFHTMLEPS